MNDHARPLSLQLDLQHDLQHDVQCKSQECECAGVHLRPRVQLLGRADPGPPSSNC